MAQPSLKPSWALSRKSALITLPVVLCLLLVHLGRIGNLAADPPASVIASLKSCDEAGTQTLKDQVLQEFPYQYVGSLLSTTTLGAGGVVSSLFDGFSNAGHVKTYQGDPVCVMSDAEWLPLSLGRYAGTASGMILWGCYLGYCILRRRENPARWLLILHGALISLPFVLVAGLLSIAAR